jgi:hypothetical protein
VASILEHQMALLQSLLRFLATEHEDCHNREESLEKVTVLTSKRRKQASRTAVLDFSEFTEFAR